jgi:hypothetical protein
VAEELPGIRKQVGILRQIDATLDAETGPLSARRGEFSALQQRLESKTDEVSQHMAGVMERFKPGLFVGGQRLNLPDDNLDLERYFRLPKSHERHIHGRAHAGIRIVQEGATLVPVLDVHQMHPGPFTAKELAPFIEARMPPVQEEAIHRRRVMRQARSRKARPLLLADLERRYVNSS